MQTKLLESADQYLMWSCNDASVSARALVLALRWFKCSLHDEINESGMKCAKIWDAVLTNMSLGVLLYEEKTASRSTIPEDKVGPRPFTPSWGMV